MHQTQSVSLSRPITREALTRVINQILLDLPEIPVDRGQRITRYEDDDISVRSSLTKDIEGNDVVIIYATIPAGIV